MFYSIWLLYTLCYYWELREQENLSSKVREQKASKNWRQSHALDHWGTENTQYVWYNEKLNKSQTNKTLPFILFVCDSLLPTRTSYIDPSLYIPTRKTYSSPCFCVFLILLLGKLLLSSIPCHSSGMKWMVLLPFAVVELFLCLSRSELQGHGLSFRKLCFLHSQYLLEDDKSILPTGCKWCGSHTVWNALGNWSQSCLGFWKEARNLVFSWVVNGAPVKRKKTDSHVLCGLCHWADGLLWFETAINVIWMLQNPDCSFSLCLAFLCGLTSRQDGLKQERNLCTIMNAGTRVQISADSSYIYHEISCHLFSDFYAGNL